MMADFDIVNPPYFEIIISEDGKTVWINTLNGCKLRAQGIDKIIMDDRRIIK